MRSSATLVQALPLISESATKRGRAGEHHPLFPAVRSRRSDLNVSCCALWGSRVERSAAVPGSRPPFVDWPPCGSTFAWGGPRVFFPPAGTPRAPRRAPPGCAFHAKGSPSSVALRAWVLTARPRSGTVPLSSPCAKGGSHGDFGKQSLLAFATAILDRQPHRSPSRRERATRSRATRRCRRR
jgi:hypothetical protein